MVRKKKIHQQDETILLVDDVGHIHTSKYTGNPVISVAAPILANGKFSGVVVVNFDAEEELYEITTDKTGMGETGEIYLVNKDGYIIAPSRFANGAFLKHEIDAGAMGASWRYRTCWHA